MPFQRSQNYRLAMNTETVWGTPLTTGATFLRIASAELNPDLQYTESEEINFAHRETVDTVAVSAKGGGTIQGEVSFGAIDRLIAAVLGNTWTGTTTRTVKVGKLLSALSFQEEFADLATNQFRLYSGAILQSLRIQVQTGRIIGWQAQFASKKPIVASTTGIGTPGAAPTAGVMNPLASIQTLTDAGAPIVGCTSADLILENDLIELPSLLTADPLAMFQGRFRVKGTLNVYTQDAVLLNKYLNQTQSAFALRIGGSAGAHYTFALPRIKYTGARNSGARGSQVMTDQYSFDGFYDATDSSVLVTAAD